MATTTKRPGPTDKVTSIEAKPAASSKPSTGKIALSKTRATTAGPKRMGAAKAAAHILPAAKGPRTVSHRKIKEAVDKVFRERAHPSA